MSAVCLHLVFLFFIEVLRRFGWLNNVTHQFWRQAMTLTQMCVTRLFIFAKFFADFTAGGLIRLMTCAVMAFSIGNVAQGFPADQAGHPAVGQLGEAGTLVFFEILN